MHKLAKSINEEILSNPLVREYLELKKDIENDEFLQSKRDYLDVLRKQICKDKNRDSEEYYSILEEYKNNPKVKRFEYLKSEIRGLIVDISDILSLN